MHSKSIQAAGGIVYRCTQKNSAQREILLVHRPKYDDLSLPKGKLLPGESWEEAALREVLEETGQRVRIESFAGPVLYSVNRIPKIVLFWNMTIAKPVRFRATSEVDRIVWMTIREALTGLTYEPERELIRKVYAGY